MIKVGTRKTKSCDLKTYDPQFADDHAFMEQTEWENGEGIDVTIQVRSTTKQFSLTHGEMDCLMALYHYKGDKDEI